MSASDNPGSAADDVATCPTCGYPVIPGARYCANCGTRLAVDAAPPITPSPPVSDHEFDATVAEVLEGDSAADDAPPPPADQEWTASVESWRTDEPAASAEQPTIPISVEPPPEGPPPPTVYEPTVYEPTVTVIERPRSRRALWIVLGILGFIFFCCFIMSILLVVAASSDSAFQDELSTFAMRVAAR